MNTDLAESYAIRTAGRNGYVSPGMVARHMMTGEAEAWRFLISLEDAGLMRSHLVGKTRRYELTDLGRARCNVLEAEHRQWLEDHLGVRQ